ncbi:MULTISPECIES: flagella basal body P-ring formation protein FlgA [unclassified Sphingomonas]|uniref:flagella basal body P-ring formation protein FlgA n=1 Tax=unclassified Sphingomonas TaxID=196159 RepID=UPI000829CBCF|nr:MULTISPECIES: flagella basal body P-ring formation protein FlgA [unclassified Sphingomonas]
MPLAPLTWLLIAAAPATPAFQDTRLIDAAVVQFTGKPVGEEGGARAPVDARLKLAACPMPQFEWRNAAHDAVVVHCMAPAWRIFVPVVRATPVAPPPAAAATPAVATRPERVAPVIKRGDPIVVEAVAVGFSITREGIAASDAAPGARLLVKVDPAKPPIQAIAIESGRATLPGWAQ